MRTLGVARLFLLVPIVLFLLPGVGRGQEWIEYVSRDDLFTVNFPAQPTVSPSTGKPNTASRFRLTSITTTRRTVTTW